MFEAIQAFVLRYLVAGLLALLGMAGCGLLYQHSTAQALQQALTLAETQRDLAKAAVAAQNALIQAHQELGKAYAVRVHDAEALAALLAQTPRPLPPVPKGCGPAAAWARSAETKASVLEHW